MVDRQGPRPMVIFGGYGVEVSFLIIGFFLMEAGYILFALGLLVSGLGAMAIGNNTTIATLLDIEDGLLASASSASYWLLTPWISPRSSFDSVHCREVGFRFQRCLHLGVDFRSGRLPSRIFNYLPLHLDAMSRS